MAVTKKKVVEKDPAGGLTAAGRKAFAVKDGSHLKPGVTGAADTPEKMKRKGSFLRRHYGHAPSPLLDKNGKPTRYALQAHAWGELVPKTAAAVKKLADKGTALLEKYHRLTEKQIEKKPRAQKKKSLSFITSYAAAASS